MDRALLDTDIFSEMLKGVDQTVAVRAAAYPRDMETPEISAFLTHLAVVSTFSVLIPRASTRSPARLTCKRPRRR